MQRTLTNMQAVDAAITFFQNGPTVSDYQAACQPVAFDDLDTERDVIPHLVARLCITFVLFLAILAGTLLFIRGNITQRDRQAQLAPAAIMQNDNVQHNETTEKPMRLADLQRFE